MQHCLRHCNTLLQQHSLFLQHCLSLACNTCHATQTISATLFITFLQHYFSRSNTFNSYSTVNHLLATPPTQHNSYNTIYHLPATQINPATLFFTQQTLIMQATLFIIFLQHTQQHKLIQQHYFHLATQINPILFIRLLQHTHHSSNTPSLTQAQALIPHT